MSLSSKNPRQYNLNNSTREMKINSHLRVISFWLALLAFICHLFFKNVSTDESEHMHFGFLVGLGYTPFYDFWQHHMPLIWYFLAPVAGFSGFISKIIFVKFLQLVVLAVSFIVLYRKIFVSNFKLPIVVFAFLIFPYAIGVDYLSVRPEFFCIPGILWLIGLNEYNYDISDNVDVLITVVVLSIIILLSPRSFPIVCVASLFIIFGRTSAQNKILLLGGICTMVSAAVFMLWDIRDILFFVFTQSSSMDRSFEYHFQFASILLIGFCLLPLVLGVTKKFALDPFLTISSIVCLLFYFIESRPFPAQSLIFVYLLSLIHLIKQISRLNQVLPINYTAGIFSVSFLVVILSRNAYQDNYFNKSDFYISRLTTCKGFTFQGEGFDQRFDNNSHPIFIEDYTYFGFYQKEILDQNMDEVLNYNSTKPGIKYSHQKQPCYFNPSVLEKLKFLKPLSPSNQ